VKINGVTMRGSAGALTEDNKLKPEDGAAHDWFRFVLSFPPHLVRDYLERFGVSKRQTVLDPFCGTGTTLVECKKRGIPSLGIEANPSVHFASQTKLRWDVDSVGLVRHARRVAESTLNVLESQGFHTESDLPLFGDSNGRGNGTALRTLPPEVMKLLLADSISTVPLHKTLVLLDILEKKKDSNYWDHERLALAQTLVFETSNLHFGPEVGVRRQKKTDAPVVSAWLRAVTNIAADLRELADLTRVGSTVYLGDARDLRDFLEPTSIDTVITSPPYPNEKDYTRTTRLESVLLGFLKNKDDLRRLKYDLVRSNTRGVYKADNDDQFIRGHKEIERIAKEIEERRIELGKTSGFERLYGRVTKLYFGGMAKHLSQLREVLRPGAHLAYVVGDQASYLRIMIRTGRLLADIAQSLGYDVEGIDLFRTRLSTATKEQLREEVVVLRWPGAHKRSRFKK